MLAPAQVVGNAAQAGGPSDGGSAEMTRLKETAQVIAKGEENGAPAPPVQAETAKAIQPTPISAKAVKVDLDADRPAKDGIVQYPITGPDKFARTIAEAKKEAYQIEQREAAGDAIARAQDGRVERAEAIGAKEAAQVAVERKSAGQAFVERGPAVSGADDSPTAAQNAEMKSEMADEALEEAYEAAAEKRKDTD